MPVISRLRLGFVLILAPFVIAGLVLVLFFLMHRSGALSTPEAVVQQYLAAHYAQDYARAYELISSSDRAYKSREIYLRENSSLTGFSLEAARQLASYIRYAKLETEAQGEGRTTVRVKFIVPNGNTDIVQTILFPAGGNDLPAAERRSLLAQLDQLHSSGQIPTVEGEQTFSLIKEGNSWRIFENWAEAVRVHFSSDVKSELPWEFEPVQAVVLAKPGETLQMAYRVKNLAGQAITAKARHIDKPEAYVDFFEIIQCFCFIQQTLQPGEEMELPLVFRVAWEVPPEVKDFYVHYEFYPLEAFPEE